MNQEYIQEMKNRIISVGQLLWEKDLASVLNGNISLRVEDKVLITGTKTCLGLLKEDDIVLIDMDGKVIGEGQVSTENLLHRDIYKAFPETEAIIHTHNVFTNAYFLENDVFEPRIFENKLWFSSIKKVPQTAPNVQDTAPVIEELKKNNVMVLGHHGTVAMGKDLFDCFLLVQELEEAIKMDAISRLYKKSSFSKAEAEPLVAGDSPQTAYEMFSQEHMDAIVALVNADSQLKELGAKTDMTFNLAVKLEETGQVYSFEFEKGAIKNVTQNEDVDFLVTAPEKVWCAVFNREVDPFVATTQKKMSLKGDFARISRFYASCSRLFELWANVPVE